MNDVELTSVSNHLGHSVNIHKHWYCQEESTVELTKVPKILITKDDGINLSNKRMTDITEGSRGKKSNCVISGLFDTDVVLLIV